MDHPHHFDNQFLVSLQPLSKIEIHGQNLLFSVSDVDDDVYKNSLKIPSKMAVFVE